MPVNADQPHRWKADSRQSVDYYNQWFLDFAPQTFRETRIETTKQVEQALEQTRNLTRITPQIIQESPSVLAMLRIATAPPLARDRLIGLADVTRNLIDNIEKRGRMPPRIYQPDLEQQLARIVVIIERLLDIDIFPWLNNIESPTPETLHRAAMIVADRLCGTVADPIIRNAQEQRQLEAIRNWLTKRDYHQISHLSDIHEMPSGSFSFRVNVAVTQTNTNRQVNIPIDTVIMPHRAKAGNMPLLIEAKSAGDFANTNKRRKEEATKIQQLRYTYGDDIQFILFLCGYFDSGYLGYEAAEGIDWVWEHRIDDLNEFGL